MKDTARLRPMRYLVRLALVEFLTTPAFMLVMMKLFNFHVRFRFEWMENFFDGVVLGALAFIATRLAFTTFFARFVEDAMQDIDPALSRVRSTVMGLLNGCLLAFILVFPPQHDAGFILCLIALALQMPITLSFTTDLLSMRRRVLQEGEFCVAGPP